MAKKSNPKLIGGFVIGAVILLIAGVLAFGGTQLFTKKEQAVLFFQGSLAGLDVGSPVQFRGIKVGAVTAVAIQYDVANQNLRIPVHIEIEPEKFQIISGSRDISNIKKLIERGLRAQLVVQSLVTGQAVIEFDFHPDAPLRLVGAEPGTLEMPTIPSDLDMLKANVTSVLGKISKLPLEEISAQLITALSSTNDTLKDLQGVVKSVGGLVGDADAQLKPLSSSLVATSDQANATLKEVQARLELREGEPMQNLNQALLGARNLVANIDAKLPQILKTVGGALDQAQATLLTAQRAIAPDSPLYFELYRTLVQLRTAATSISVFAEYIQRNPSALLTGKR